MKDGSVGIQLLNAVCSVNKAIALISALRHTVLFFNSYCQHYKKPTIMSNENKQKYAAYKRQRRNHIIAIVAMSVLFIAMMISGILAGVELFALIILGIFGGFGIALVYFVSEPNVPKE